MVRTDSIINTIKKDKVESTYQAMTEVRKVYENSENRVKMLPVLDGMAFLHLGISLMFRLSNDKDCNLKEAIKESQKRQKLILEVDSVTENLDKNKKRFDIMVLEYLFKKVFAVSLRRRKGRI